MNNLARTIRLLLLTLITTMLFGCAAQAETSNLSKVDCQIENALYETAKNNVSVMSQEMAPTANAYYVDRVEELNALGIFSKKDSSLLWYCTIPEDFDGGEDPFNNLKYSVSEKELPQTAYNSLEIAKKLVCDYVDSSSIIRDDDKSEIKDVIMNVKVHYITLEDEHKKNSVMITHGVEIYVNDDMPEKVLTAHTFAHELIHVVSNITNIGSEYEDSYYNSCEISEAITEMLAQMIVLNSDYADEFVKGVSYEWDFEFALALLGRYDILKAYFYSDYYEEILKDVNKEAFDLYYLAIESLEVEEKMMNNNVYVIWQQIEE